MIRILSTFAEELYVFTCAASKPPTEEIAKAFEKKTNTKVNLTFGGSGSAGSTQFRRNGSKN